MLRTRLRPLASHRLLLSAPTRLAAGAATAARASGAGGRGAAVATLTAYAAWRTTATRCEVAPVVVKPAEPAVAEMRLYDENGRLQLRVLGQLIMRCATVFVILGPVALIGLLLHTPLAARVRPYFLGLLVSSLAECGPVGIKWGQWASTRYDLFEDDVCEALGELTNRAPVHPWAHTQRLVEAAFGAPVGDIFATFDVKPIASGSIAA